VELASRILHEGGGGGGGDWNMIMNQARAFSVESEEEIDAWEGRNNCFFPFFAAVAYKQKNAKNMNSAVGWHFGQRGWLR
jgi:hypothetical protein